MRIAVTGGLGRLGRCVMAALAGAHEVVAVDRAPADGTLPSIQADLSDPAALRAAFAGAETVIHIGGIDRSVGASDEKTLATNVGGTWNVFAASRAAGVRRVVHCSSTAVTGIDASNPRLAPLYLPIDEAHPLRPTDAYAVSKLAGESIAEAFARDGVLEVLTLRPAFIAFAEMEDFMAGLRAGAAGRSEPMPYLRAYIGPQDCAEAFRRAATLPRLGGHAAVFVAADDCFAPTPTVARMEALYGTRLDLRRPELYAAHPFASPIDATRARDLLGWRPTTRWSDGAVRPLAAGQY